MGTKTITITESAYERLAAQKQLGESFTDVILRLTEPPAPRLSELHKLLQPDAAENLAAAIQQGRRERAAGRRAASRAGER